MGMPEEPDLRTEQPGREVQQEAKPGKGPQARPPVGRSPHGGGGPPLEQQSEENQRTGKVDENGDRYHGDHAAPVIEASLLMDGRPRELLLVHGSILSLFALLYQKVTHSSTFVLGAEGAIPFPTPFMRLHLPPYF